MDFVSSKNALRMVVQAPAHVIEKARAAAKAGDDPKKRRKLQRSKPADGVVGWTEETYERLRGATPEALVSRMRVNHSMILNVINQPADPVATLRTLMEDNHEDEHGRARWRLTEARRRVESLSKREREVLELICQDLDDAAISERLGLSRNTVRNHVARLYAKIGVNRRSAAIVWAHERGVGPS